MLSRYCKDIADWYGIKDGGVKKLIPNLSDKVNYVVHYKNLLYYLSLGMKLLGCIEYYVLNKVIGKGFLQTSILKQDKKVLINFQKIYVSFLTMAFMVNLLKISEKESM